MPQKVDKLNHYSLFIEEKEINKWDSNQAAKQKFKVDNNFYQALMGWDRSHPTNPSLEQL